MLGQLSPEQLLLKLKKPAIDRRESLPSIVEGNIEVHSS